MDKKISKQLVFFILSALLIVAFPFFFIKYVPLIEPFLYLFVPLLFLAFILTALKKEWGTIFFAFSFPLVNSLPYFFGLFEHIPQAPTALVLFLAYFLGWSVNQCFSEVKVSLRAAIFKPMLIIGFLVFLSSIITILRYSNFFPFLSKNIYELSTNVNGVTSGGAIMSALFNALNYLTGFAFFIIAFNVIRSNRVAKKILFAIAASTSISVIFGFYQHFINMNIGNTPFWVQMGQVNSTFKDPNSFGVFLGSVWPLILGLSFASKGFKRICLGAVLILILFVYPQIGSRSSFLGLVISVFIFLLLFLYAYLKKPHQYNRKKKPRIFKVAIGIIIAAFCLAGMTYLLTTSQSKLLYRLKGNVKTLSSVGELISISPERYFLWKEAVHMTQDYPLTGVGVGAFIIELPNYYQKDTKLYENNLEAFRRIDSAENYFLQVSSELGFTGLICIFWLFWTIFYQIKKTFQTYSFNDKNTFILIGATAGFFSLLVNFFFHSYIGAFEIKYTFWLLVALVFCLGKSEGEKGKEEKVLFSRNFKIFSVILIAIFGVTHLWNSTHTLSLKSRTEQFELVQNFGFYQGEKDQSGREFRWTKSYGGTTIKIEKPVIEIPLLAAHPDIRGKSVEVEIYVVKNFFKHKKLLGKLTLKQSAWKTYTYSIPDEVGEDVILLFKVSRTWNPLKAFGTPDPRNLGVAIGKIQFKEK